MKSLTNYQESGFVPVTRQSAQQSALRAANARITAARNATPEQYRIEFKSRIQWDGTGYWWEWVLR